MNVYLAQFSPALPNDGSYNKILWLPYSTGCVWAYANQHAEVRENFTLKDFFIEKVDPKALIDSLDQPAVFGFSVYVWNCQYSLEIARLVKQRFPSCVIVFGGPHVPTSDVQWLQRNRCVDYAVYKEGELVFHNLLRRLLGFDHSTQGMGFLDQHDQLNPQDATQRIQDLSQLPSPYTTGCFDGVIQRYRHTDRTLNAVIETNRGCPFKCTYCDWGGLIETKIKQFDRCRVHEELDWLAQHHIEFVAIADANFGAFRQRDLDTVDYMIHLRHEWGYPKKYSLSWHKNHGEHLVEMARRLMEAGLLKTYTASLQSMNKSTLTAIKRTNLDDAVLDRMQRLCASHGFKMSTDLIVPLPEETVTTFRQCLEHCCLRDIPFLCAHTSVLPNAEMSEPQYRARYGLETRWDRYQEPSAWVDEWDEVVVATHAMSRQEFNDVMLLSFIMQTFHQVGFTDVVAHYFHHRHHVAYCDFYSDMWRWFITRPHTVLYPHLRPMEHHVRDGVTSLTYASLQSVPMLNDVGRDQRSRFYREFTEFVTECMPATDHVADLIQCQQEHQDHRWDAHTTTITVASNLYDYCIEGDQWRDDVTTYEFEGRGGQREYASFGHYLLWAKSTGVWQCDVRRAAATKERSDSRTVATDFDALAS